MEISWLGHACFRLRSGNVILITDPFPSSLGISFGHPVAHIVTVSNPHPHHSNLGDFTEEPETVLGPGEYEIQQFYIRGIPTGASRDGDRQNTAYVIHAEGLTLCHLGDLVHPVPTKVAEEFRATDILFVPVGGDCTLSASEATALVQVLEPRIVVPMHFAMAGLQLDLEGVEPFLRAAGARDQPYETRLSITRSSLPPERRVVVFEPSP